MTESDRGGCHTRHAVPCTGRHPDLRRCDRAGSPSRAPRTGDRPRRASASRYGDADARSNLLSSGCPRDVASSSRLSSSCVWVWPPQSVSIRRKIGHAGHQRLGMVTLRNPGRPRTHRPSRGRGPISARGRRSPRSPECSPPRDHFSIWPSRSIPDRIIHLKSASVRFSSITKVTLITSWPNRGAATPPHSTSATADSSTSSLQRQIVDFALVSPRDRRQRDGA